MDLASKIILIVVVVNIIILFSSTCVIMFFPYIKARKYPKTINFKDVEFVEEGKEVEINMVSGQNEFLDFEKYKKEFEEANKKRRININGLFVNIDNIESTSLCTHGTAKYKDFEFLYIEYRGEIDIYRELKGVTVLYSLKDDLFYKKL